MPNIKSQEKRDRQNIKRASRNQAAKSKIKTLSKNFQSSVASNQVDEAKGNMNEYFKALDKAAKTNTVHKNFAANKKSKAAKLLNKAKSK
ncbi:MAG TPA: 30S ribosomal protein S20 [Methanosarcinales archaeon]|nr:30S ribosomal protein S20 [Methanosarcinales archaeon]